MGLYSTTASAAQDGYSLLGAWVGGSADLPLQSGVTTLIGLQFSIVTTFDSQGRPVDPPILYPSFDLTLVGSTVAWGVQTTFPIAVWYVPEAAPAPYSNLLLPGNRNEVLLVTDNLVRPAEQITITVPTLTMIPYIRQSSWNGIVSLTLVGGAPLFSALNFYSADSASPTLAPSIDTTETPFFTGIEGTSPDMGRPVRDMRTGLPLHATDLVEDGYRPGIWTHPTQWDPEDPRDSHPVDFPDDEGRWDDDIPAH